MLDLLTSTLASQTRLWAGTKAAATKISEQQPLIMYDNAADPCCRLVREAISELNLDVLIIPCPRQGERHMQHLQEAYQCDSLPVLVDNNTQTLLNSTSAIITYLYRQYANTTPPLRLRLNPLNYASSQAASLLRWNAGKYKRAAHIPTDPLVLYSFESSPYARPVRETLCELEIPYLLVNLGKQQWGELGPAKRRLQKDSEPLADTKRSQFWAEHGTVQVPYLIDPNHDTAMFESRAIVDYLTTTYAIA